MNEITRKAEAWRFFFPKGNGKAMITVDPITHKEIYWVLHHVDIDLKKNDPKRYKEWRIEDLVMMTIKDHAKIHLLGKPLKETTKQKMSNVRKGIQFSEETIKKMSEAKKDKHPSEETRKNMSESHKGKIPWNKGMTYTLEERHNLKDERERNH